MVTDPSHPRCSGNRTRAQCRRASGGKEGDPVSPHADATSAEALGHAHIERARAVVVMIVTLNYFSGYLIDPTGSR